MKISGAIYPNFKPKDKESVEYKSLDSIEKSTISESDEAIRVEFEDLVYLFVVSAVENLRFTRLKKKFESLRDKIVTYTHGESVEKLFRLSCGLDIEPVGSDRWYRQLDSEMSSAREADRIGPIFSKLHRDLTRVVKRAIGSTGIRDGAVDSISASADLANKIFGELDETNIVIHASPSFRNRVREVFEKRGVLSMNSVSKLSLKELYNKGIDILVIGDGKAGSVDLGGDNIVNELSTRDSPFLILDFGERPVSIPSQNEISTLYYTHSDSYEEVISRNIRMRKESVKEVEELIEPELKKFIKWTESDKWDVSKSIVARSRLMQEVFELIDKVAPTNATVLITGETGTGKELVAKAIHRSSPRGGEPFIVVNCGAIPENLLESTLFGYLKGSFTGAVDDRKGMFQAADGGVIFLDEIGELPLALQVKLLRALQDNEIQPVGSEKGVIVDVRVIAATNKNLFEAVNNGEFRQDLYYRLNVVEIRVPPLRERPEDILVLTEHFLREQVIKNKISPLSISGEATEALRQYDWPGNVRELQNAVERLAVLSSTNHITMKELPLRILQSKSDDKTVSNKSSLTLEEVEERHIRGELKKYSYNYSAVADLLGIGRTTLWRKMKKYGIKEESRSGSDEISY